MHRLIRFIDALNEQVAKWASLLILFLILLTVQQVFARYLFQDSSMAAQEWEWHLFALVFLLGSPNTLRKNSHVRVDLIQNRLSDVAKARMEIIGTILFLFPFCGLTIYHGIHFAAQSYQYVNPHPQDYLSLSWFGNESVFYPIVAWVEKLLRSFLLVGEVSSNPGGLEARWLIKASIPVAFSLLLLQGIAQLFRSFEKLKSPTPQSSSS